MNNKKIPGRRNLFNPVFHCKEEDVDIIIKMPSSSNFQALA